LRSVPSDISASEVAGILNKNCVAEYEPVSPCAVGKTENWKKYCEKIKSLKKKWCFEYFFSNFQLPYQYPVVSPDKNVTSYTIPAMVPFRAQCVSTTIRQLQVIFWKKLRKEYNWIKITLEVIYIVILSELYWENEVRNGQYKKSM